MRLSALLLSLVCYAYAEDITQDIQCECEKCSKVEPQATCNADIMILMDSSVCHKDGSWSRIRQFGIKMAQQLDRTIDVQNSESRIAFYSFSNRVSAVTEFSDSFENAVVKAGSDEHNALLGGNTKFDIMTDEVLDVFSKSKASHKYVILITNGEGTKSKDSSGRKKYDEESIEQLSNQMKAANIRVIPVSINDVCSEEEKERPDHNCPMINLLQIWSYNSGLANAEVPYSMRTVSTPRVISKKINEHLVEDVDNCQAEPRPPQPHQCQLADITILVDGSDSITRDQWNRQTLPAVTSWMSGYWRDSSETQISVLQFSNEVEEIYGPAFENDDANWEQRVHDSEQLAGSTSLHHALEYVTSDSFFDQRNRKLQRRNGRLNDRFRMLFVLSDGWPTDADFDQLSSSGTVQKIKS